MRVELFVPAGASVNPKRWVQQCAAHFQCDLTVIVNDENSLELQVIRVGSALVDAVTVRAVAGELTADARSRAERAVHAMGGAGFDALLARAVRVWTIESGESRAEKRAAYVVAGLLALEWGAPVLPPEGHAMFGVKGARARIAAHD